MGPGGWWLCLCAVGIFAVPCRGAGQCVEEITINVILLNDEEYPWSLTYVEGEILEAIDTDSAINAAVGKKMT